MLASLANAYGAAGRRSEAREILDELIELSKTAYVSPYNLALIHVGMDWRDQAIESLLRAYQERSSWMPYLKVEPRFDNLRSDLHFQELIRRMNFPDR